MFACRLLAVCLQLCLQLAYCLFAVRFLQFDCTLVACTFLAAFALHALALALALALVALALHAIPLALLALALQNVNGLVALQVVTYNTSHANFRSFVVI